jgi:hypothetical protein
MRRAADAHTFVGRSPRARSGGSILLITAFVPRRPGCSERGDEGAAHTTCHGRVDPSGSDTAWAVDRDEIDERDADDVRACARLVRLDLRGRLQSS